MYDMVRLGRKHALDKVLDIAENYTVPLATSCLLGCQWFDLETLKNRNWELSRRSIGLVEDGAGRTHQSVWNKQTPNDGTERQKLTSGRPL